MNRMRIRIPKSWILLAVFIVSVMGAGAYIFTTPPNGLTNQTGSYFGNTSNNANNYTADRIDVMNYFGTVVGTYLDSYSCKGDYCVYQPWYSSGQTYAKNMTTGKIDYSGTTGNTVINSALATGKPYILVADGVYTGGTITFAADNQTLEGSGASTIIQKTTAENNVIYAINKDGITLKNIVIDAAETGVIVATKKAVLIDGDLVTNQVNNNVTIEDVSILNTNKEALNIVYTTNLVLHNINIRSYQQANTYDGILLYGVTNAYLDTLNIWSGDDSIVLNSVNHSTINNIMSFNGTAGATLKFRGDSGSAGNITDVVATNIIGANKPYGVLALIDAPNLYMYNVQISNLNVINATTSGIELNTAGGSQMAIDQVTLTGIHIINDVPKPNAGTASKQNGIATLGNLIGTVQMDNLIIKNVANFSIDARTTSRASISNFDITVPNPLTPATDVGIVFQGSNSSVYNVHDGYIQATTGLSYQNVNSKIYIRNVNVSASNTKTTGTSRSQYIAYNNFGLSPYNFGNNATAPTQFGDGDTYYNTTSHDQCWYKNNAWKNATGIGAPGGIC